MDFDYWLCRLGVTGITSIGPRDPSRENPTRDALEPVIERCDYVLPQAYSVASIKGVSVRNNPLYHPGNTQRRANELWRTFDKPIVMGLAAWNLNQPRGISRTTAMQRVILAVENLVNPSLVNPSVEEVAYWHLKFLYNPGDREKADFVRQAALKARLGISQSSNLDSGLPEYDEASPQREWEYY